MGRRRWSPTREKERYRLPRAIQRIGLGLILTLAVAAARGLWPLAALATETVRASDTALAHPGKVTTILIMGLDQNVVGPGLLSSAHARADILKLAILDPAAGEIRILSLPRDLLVRIPGYGLRKINAAHALGGTALQIQAVEALTGVPVHRHLVVTQHAVRHLLDAVGPLELEVESRLDYDDDWGDLHVHLEKGPQSLDGMKTVGYVRYRGAPDWDLGRIRRQDQVARALRQRLGSPMAWPGIPTAFETLRTETRTDLSREEMLLLARRAAMAGCRLRSWTLSNCARNGAEGSFLLPTQPEDDARRLLALDPELASGKRFRILNATRIPGYAARTRERLQAFGYRNIQIGNAEEKADRILLRYRMGQGDLARQVSRLFSDVDLEALDALDHDVEVVLGGQREDVAWP